MLSNATVEPNVVRASLEYEARREVAVEKWIQSERAGYDLGEKVVRYWIMVHWPGFLRARWIEHMLGIRYWEELRRDEFGLLLRQSIISPPLLDLLVEKLKCGAENLDLLCWCIREISAEQQCQFTQLLEIININAHRLQCTFFDEPGADMAV